ncbi:hypothetical protein [Janthinobacterium sp. JC611]|uniref:hypothetical protein n=1 Tax=Janthinobacterium sp. JC611 TaxID=2816201 RepID=UPI001BFD10C1|nr:hypothetical protein [Janthinobacterium sp. JC611]
MKQKILQNKYFQWCCIESQPHKAEALAQAVHARCPFLVVEGLQCLKAGGGGFFGKRIVKNNQISRKITSVALQLDRI